ncbi:MAG: biotin transporter BioY [Acidobacteriales bacterium]|nr:biotin transporter BioY [Terriglobales bacterium]
MQRAATQALNVQDRGREWIQDGALVVGGAAVIALCARLTVPLPFTPVPLTLQNFGVLLVGLLLGSRRGFSAALLYLAAGVSGAPVFNPAGPGGIAQLFGPTGGFLLAYPFVAGLAGWIMERGRSTFARAATAGLLAEILLFVGGLTWLGVLTHSFAQAIRFGLYWFVFAEVIKVMFAAAAASGWGRITRTRN